EIPATAIYDLLTGDPNVDRGGDQVAEREETSPTRVSHRDRQVAENSPDLLQAIYDRMAADDRQFPTVHDGLAEENQRLQAAHQQLQTEHGLRASESQQLLTEHEQLQAAHDQLRTEYDQVRDQLDRAMTELTTIRADLGGVVPADIQALVE